MLTFTPPYAPSYVPPAGQPNATLLEEGIALTAVAAATATGTGFSYNFTLPPAKGNVPLSIEYHAFGVYSVCTFKLEASDDGGANWFLVTPNVGQSIDAAESPDANINPLVPGMLYRLNILTFTGTSITIRVVPV